MDEETFRNMLDARGILLAEAVLEPPSPLLVFAQRSDARLDVGALRQHASRFFGAKLGLTVDKSYPVFLERDAAHVVVATDDPRASGTRLCLGRPAEETDWARAEAAERASTNAGGMSQLARRCKTVWLVAREPSAPSSTRDVAAAAEAVDKVALLLAAIFASVLLGPIVDAGAIFGVRTARLRLEQPAPSPYR